MSLDDYVCKHSSVGLLLVQHVFCAKLSMYNIPEKHHHKLGVENEAKVGGANEDFKGVLHFASSEV